MKANKTNAQNKIWVTDSDNKIDGELMASTELEKVSLLSNYF